MSSTIGLSIIRNIGMPQEAPILVRLDPCSGPRRELLAGAASRQLQRRDRSYVAREMTCSRLEAVAAPLPPSVRARGPNPEAGGPKLEAQVRAVLGTVHHRARNPLEDSVPPAVGAEALSGDRDPDVQSSFRAA